MNMEKPISIKIEKIKEISYQCKEIPDNLIQIINDTNIAFGLGFKLNPYPKTSEFGISLLVKYELQLNDSKDVLCDYEIECVFKIFEYNDAVLLDGAEVKINDGILINFLSLTIGAARGMLSIKTTGSILNKFPLPMLDPQVILQNLKEQKVPQT